jgi:hypothetical protein
MEFIAFYVEGCHFLVGNLDALGIDIGIEFTPNFVTAHP